MAAGLLSTPLTTATNAPIPVVPGAIVAGQTPQGQITQGGTIVSPVTATPTATTGVNMANANATLPTAVQQTTPSLMTMNAPTDTVAGQVGSLIDANSPLMQRAAARANEQSNARGLLNSSMAVGEAQKAVIDSAVPIATADANAYRTTSLANADMTNQASQFNAQQQNTMNTTASQLQTDVSKVNAQQQNAITINQLDQANKIQLADIQAQYSNQMQSNAGSSSLFNQAMGAISAIQNSTTMDAATKLASTNQQISMLNAGLAMQNQIAGLNLTPVLNFV